MIVIDVQVPVLPFAVLFFAAILIFIWACYRDRQAGWEKRSRLPLPPLVDQDQLDLDSKPSHVWPSFAHPADSGTGIIRLQTREESILWRWFQRLLGGGSSSVTLVLNDVKAATNLLDVRSANYSDRPVAVTGNQLRSHGLSVPFTPYGDLFRRHRRAFTAAFARAAVPRYDGNVRADLLMLLRVLADHAPQAKPAGDRAWFDHVYRFVTSQTMHTTYGRRVADVNNDAFVLTARECNENFFAMNKPGGFLVDRVPVLARLPLWINPWKKMCEPWFRKELELFRSEMLASLTDPNRKPSLAQKVYSTRSETGLSDEQAAYLCGTMYGASVDTTFQALGVFFLAAANHPDAMRRLQDEIDTVVGHDRLPTHEDLDALPLCNAVVKETLRWRPFAHGAAPHRVLQDDEYDGQHIPRGATVYGNVWAIHQDPRLFNQPQEFIPERYLGDSSEWIHRAALPSRRDMFSFGFGRRICPGEQLAMRTLTLTVACLLSSFNIRAPLDPATGTEAALDDTAFHTDSLSSTPKPFAVRVVPRDADRLRLLLDMEPC